MASPSSSIPQLKILRAYAKLDDASLAATLPPTVYFSHTRHTLTIFDAYPKALFHFLVLPRLRITTSSSSPAEDRDEDKTGELGRDSDAAGASVKVVVADRTADLTSLRTLLQRAASTSASGATASDTSIGPDSDSDSRARAKGTLSVLSDEATRLQDQIEREMQAHYGFKWPIWIGFHSIPSME